MCSIVDSAKVSMLCSAQSQSIYRTRLVLLCLRRLALRSHGLATECPSQTYMYCNHGVAGCG